VFGRFDMATVRACSESRLIRYRRMEEQRRQASTFECWLCPNESGTDDDVGTLFSLPKEVECHVGLSALSCPFSPTPKAICLLPGIMCIC
jgi:hypothetical protein